MGGGKQNGDGRRRKKKKKEVVGDGEEFGLKGEKWAEPNEVVRNIKHYFFCFFPRLSLQIHKIIIPLVHLDFVWARKWRGRA